MAGRIFLYLVILSGCGIFYIAYGEWLSWVVLATTVMVPWLSLALSLPAIFRFRVTPAGATAVETGRDCPLWLLGSCSYPMPPFRGRLRLTHLQTGETRRYREHQGLPTGHCGGFRVTAEKVRICDYLGLFSFPIRKKDAITVLVRPKPLEVPAPGDLQRYIARSWKPKFGGGYAENHELRLYRPGDSLNQVHWKLSAKTGKLILREPMEPQRGPVLLTLDLRGSPEELDRKLGRLFWLGGYILQEQLRFEVRALTGEGILTFPVATEEELQKCVDTLLCTPLATEGSLREQAYRASWQYHLGGDGDEV